MFNNRELLEQYIIWAHVGGRFAPEYSKPSYAFSNSDMCFLLIDDDTGLKLDKRIAYLAKQYQKDTHDWRTPIEWKLVKLQSCSVYVRSRFLRMKIDMYKAKLQDYENYLVDNM